MKLLILGVLAVALLAAASSQDCFWQWRGEARERAIEAREQARVAREQAREFRRRERDEMRVWHEQIREERDRIRQEIRDNLRDLHQDWRTTY